MIQREESFGIIPLMLDQGTWRVFLIQHQKGRHWGFPKGHKEKGEEDQETAIRELLEETALGIKRFLHPEPLLEEYSFRREGKPVRKKVVYFIAEATGTYDLDPKEIHSGGWFSLQEAATQVTFPATKEIVKQVDKFLAKTFSA